MGKGQSVYLLNVQRIKDLSPFRFLKEKTKPKKCQSKGNWDVQREGLSTTHTWVLENHVFVTSSFGVSVIFLLIHIHIGLTIIYLTK